MQSEGRSARCIFIAEAGINHNGDIGLAKELAKAAKDCGADIVKYQSFSADGLAVKSALAAPHVDEALGVSGSVYDLLKKLELSEREHQDLAAYCAGIGIEFLSTPLDEGFVGFLDALGMRRFKIASMDLNNVPLLRAIGAKRKPAILSTGMGNLGEVERALSVLSEAGCPEVTVLHCVSVYPAPIDQVHLRAMDVLRQTFGCPVGYSDHTQGMAAALAAVARGASVIEKHFTLDRNMPGPDQTLSATPAEMAEMIRLARDIEQALGKPQKSPIEAETGMRAAFRRSVVASRALAKGEPLKNALTLKRPGTGIEPQWMDLLQDAYAKQAIEAETLIAWKDVEWR